MVVPQPRRAPFHRFVWLARLLTAFLAVFHLHHSRGQHGAFALVRIQPAYTTTAYPPVAISSLRTQRRKYQVIPVSTSGKTYLYGISGNHDIDADENLLSAASSGTRLSHAMLLVPSVDETVAYWKETAQAQVTASSKLSDDSDELRSAMVVLGNGRKSAESCFALELVKSKYPPEKFDLGNGLSYLGISMLLQYRSKEDLVDVIVGDKKNEKDRSEKTDPNGITVKPCASAPGDYLARICLRSNNMQSTRDFYTSVLGMKVVAVDHKMLCLRYAPPDDVRINKADDSNNNRQSYGVPTTLVFEPMPDAMELDIGNCFDHIVIATNANIDDVFEQVQNAIEEVDDDWNCPTFMKPTDMFGRKVFGVKDPNGYRVILAG